MLVLIPILVPPAIALGIDPVQFGLVFVLNLMIGTITPPVGVVLYVTAKVARRSVRARWRARSCPTSCRSSRCLRCHRVARRDDLPPVAFDVALRYAHAMTTPVSSTRIRGVLTPVVTPFDRDLMPDAKRLVRQCRWLLEQDVGLAVFGTNSEANSLSLDGKAGAARCARRGGPSRRRMMPGTGCCALSDSVELTRHAVELGCAGVLMLPPFYYKGVSDEGLFRSFSEIIQRVGDARLRIYVYHIPPVSQVADLAAADRAPA